MTQEGNTPDAVNEAAMDLPLAEELAGWAAENRDNYEALDARWPALRAGFACAAAEATRDDELVLAYTAAAIQYLIARKNWKEALDWLAEAARSCERTGDDEMLAVVHTRAGLTHCLRGIFQSGYDEYARAVPLLEKSGDKAALASVEGDLGLLALAMANTRARAHLERSVMLSYQSKQRTKASQFIEHVLVILITQGADAAAALARTRLQSPD